MRSEKISTRAMLAGEDDRANGTHPAVRRRELAAVRAYWPSDLLALASDPEIPWRTLVDPTRFHDVPAEEVAAWTRAFIADHGRWPSIDGIRRQCGRVSNHRAPGESPDQVVLPV